MDGSPFKEFKIQAMRKIPDSDEFWPCMFDVKYDERKDEKKGEKKNDNNKPTERGRIGLWSAVLSEKDILNVSMSCLDSNY